MTNTDTNKVLFLTTCALIAGFATGVIVTSEPDNAKMVLPCATEDSDNCYWNADEMGNLKGTDFVTIDGDTFRKVSE